MVLKWLGNVLVGNKRDVFKKETRNPEGDRGKHLQKAKLMDVAHQALQESATDYGVLVRSGMASVTRRKLKEKVKKGVAGTIDSEFDEPEIVEEVTERITDAAEIDPYYRRWFEE